MADEGWADRTVRIEGELARYVDDTWVREPSAAAGLLDETSKLRNRGMLSSPTQNRILHWLLGALGAERAIEIGVFTGYSSLWTASALPDGGTLVACDVSDEWTSIGRPFWDDAGVADRIDLRLGPAGDTLDALLAEGGAESFDYAFIDADKSNYGEYYERCLQLVRSGGVIAIDNVLWGGSVVDPDRTDPDTEAIRAINAKIADDDRVEACLLPVGDGVTLARVL